MIRDISKALADIAKCIKPVVTKLGFVEDLQKTFVDPAARLQDSIPKSNLPSATAQHIKAIATLLQAPEEKKAKKRKSLPSAGNAEADKDAKKKSKKQKTS